MHWAFHLRWSLQLTRFDDGEAQRALPGCHCRELRSCLDVWTSWACSRSPNKCGRRSVKPHELHRSEETQRTGRNRAIDVSADKRSPSLVGISAAFLKWGSSITVTQRYRSVDLGNEISERLTVSDLDVNIHYVCNIGERVRLAPHHNVFQVSSHALPKVSR